MVPDSSFPRLVEILDAIAQHLYQNPNLFLDRGKDDICNFRLTARDFANVGARYLVPNLTIMRVPNSFDRANRIASHQQIRMSVEQLTIYCDYIQVTDRSYEFRDFVKHKNMELTRFQEKWDVLRLKLILRKFPRIKTVRVGFMKETTPPHAGDKLIATSSGLRGFSFDSTTRFSSRTFKVLEAIGRVERIKITQVTARNATRWPPACFETMRKLEIDIHHIGRPRESMPIFSRMPHLEELSYRCLMRYTGLFLKLPPTIRKVRLFNVALKASDLPSCLTHIELTNTKLSNSDLSAWADLITLWSTQSDLSIYGILYANSSLDPHSFDGEIRRYEDRILGVRLGYVLREICESKSLDAGLKRELLDEIFDRPSHTFTLSNTQPHNISISEDLALRYQGVSRLNIVVPNQRP